MCHCHQFQMGCFFVCLAKIRLGGSGYGGPCFYRRQGEAWVMTFSSELAQKTINITVSSQRARACVFTQLLRMMKCTLIAFCTEQSVHTSKHLLLESYTHKPTVKQRMIPFSTQTTGHIHPFFSFPFSTRKHTHIFVHSSSTHYNPHTHTSTYTHRLTGHFM